MQVSPESNPRGAPSRQEYLEGFLFVLAAVVVVGFVIGGLSLLALAARSPEGTDPGEVLLVGAVLLGGLSLGGMLAGLATLLRQQRTTAGRARPTPVGQQQPPGVAQQAGQAPGPEAVGSASSGTALWSAEIPELLREIRDTVLLDDQQRRERWQRLQTRRRQELVSAIRRALGDEGSLVEAQRLLSQLGEKFPEAEEADGLGQEYAQARMRLQARDMEQTRRKVLELEGVNSYQRAEEVAEALVHRHPELPAAKNLLAQVRQHRQDHYDQERARQFGELDRLTLAKQWQQALQTAEGFLASFPRSPEAGLVRERLAVLRSNAEIGKRHRLEGQFKELLKGQRYAQALELAQFIVATYPQSPQAEALREQLPRLTQLAGDS